MNGVLAVRAFGCPDSASARILATAEGVDAGVRRSLPLSLQTPTPGVHVVPKAWSTGVWVLRIVGHCDGRTAGALVTLAPSGAYRRDGVEHIAGEPTPAQVDRVLRVLTGAQATVAAAQ
jgi:hypothetical protein